jgi:acetyl-CoA carboxylase carboxyltransferase component
MSREEHKVSWDKELQELALRKELAARMGGEAKVRRHREGGKLPVRERITGMVD